MLPVFIACQIIITNIEIEEFERPKQGLGWRIMGQLRFKGKENE